MRRKEGELHLPDELCFVPVGVFLFTCLGFLSLLYTPQPFVIFT